MRRLYRQIDGNGTLEVHGPIQDWESMETRWRRMTRREAAWHELWRPRLSLGTALLIFGVIYGIRFISEALA